jgi:hypothetical protein
MKWKEGRPWLVYNHDSCGNVMTCSTCVDFYANYGRDKNILANLKDHERNRINCMCISKQNVMFSPISLF